MPKEFRQSTIHIPDQPCQRCPSQEWLENNGQPAYCARCKHPFPKYTFSSEKERKLYTNANEKLNEKDYDSSLDMFQEYVSIYPNNPDGLLGLLLSQYKISYEPDTKSGTYIPRNHDIQLPPNFDKEKLFSDALTLYKKLGDEQAYQHWISLGAKLNQTIKEYNTFVKDAKPCDIFISFKHTIEDPKNPGVYIDSPDVRYAQGLYNHLLTQGYSPEQVFFSKVDNLLYTGDFEAKIYYKLKTAKQFILIGSSIESIESPWVKNEWARYLGMLKNGQKHPESFVLALANKHNILPSLDSRLKKLNIIDLNDQYLDVITTIIKSTKDRIFGFTPPIAPIDIEKLMEHSSESEVDVTLTTKKTPLVIPQHAITDMEKRQISLLEIEWQNRNLEKAKIIAEKILSDYPYNLTALKYLFFIKTKIKSFADLDQEKWLNEMTDLQLLFNYISAVQYKDRLVILNQLMTLSFILLVKNNPLVYALISILVLTPNLINDETIISKYIQQLRAHLEKFTDFSLFDIIADYDHKLVNADNLKLYLSILSRITLIEMKAHGKQSLNYLNRLLKYDAKIIDKPYEYLLFKRILIYQFSILKEDQHFESKLGEIILAIATHLQKDSFYVDIHHLLIRLALSRGAFESASTYLASLQAISEKSEYTLYYFFFIEHKIRDLDDLMIRRELINNTAFENVANRLLESDNLKLAKTWLSLQEVYKEKDQFIKSDYELDVLLSVMNLKTFRGEDNHEYWQLKKPLLSKPYSGPLTIKGEATINEIFFESIKHITNPEITIIAPTSFSFKNIYSFENFNNVVVHLDPSSLTAKKSPVGYPITVRLNKYDNSDNMEVKINLNKYMIQSRIGESEALNASGIISLFGINLDDVFNDERQNYIARNVASKIIIDRFYDKEFEQWLTKKYKDLIFHGYIQNGILKVGLRYVYLLKEPLIKLLNLDEQDNKQLTNDAFDKFSLAAENLYPKAMHNLAYLYVFGEGVQKDVFKAARLFIKAIELGLKESDEPLMKLLVFNRKLLEQEDIIAFLKLYKKTMITDTKPIQLNFNLAEIKRDILEKYKDDVDSSEELVALLFGLQIEHNNIEANMILTDFYNEGKYFKKDKIKALNRYEKLCLSGHKEACERFLDVTKDAVNKKLIIEDDALRSRVIRVQEILKK